MWAGLAGDGRDLLELWLLLCGLGNGEGGGQVTCGRVRMQIISWCGLNRVDGA